jgi:hypothetical protein
VKRGGWKAERERKSEREKERQSERDTRICNIHIRIRARALTTYAYVSSKEENTSFRKKHAFDFLLTRASEPRDHA